MEKQNGKEKSHKIILIVTGIFLVLLAFLFLHQGTMLDPVIYTPSERINYRENPWILSQGDKILDEKLELIKYMALEPGKIYSLKTKITYDGTEDESPYAFLHVDHLFCRAFLDGEEIFSFMPEDVHKWDYSKSPGFVYKCFPLPHDCKGREIEIQILPPLNSSVEYGLPDLLFGDYASSLRMAVNRDAPHNMMMVICAAMGISFLLFSALTLHGSDYREGISIGIFCILFAAYMLTESRINIFYIGNPYLMYIINYFSLSLLPVFLMCFMKERLPDRYRKLWNTVIFAAFVFFLTMLTLHISGIYDLKEGILWIHIVSFGEVALIMVLMMTMENKKRKKTLFLQSVLLFTGILLDILIYQFHWRIGSNDATFTMTGVLAFLIIEAIRICRTGMRIYKDSIQSSLYRKLAYVDELTNAGNRRAYDEEIDRIISGKRKFDSMTVISSDVNHLKSVNDNFGHAAGDKVISGAAHILKFVVGDRGKIFRTGGDEFVLFLYDVEEEEYGEMMNAARKEIDSFNEMNPYVMSLAVGAVRIQDEQVLEAVRSADARMYEDKVNKRGNRE